MIIGMRPFGGIDHLALMAPGTLGDGMKWLVGVVALTSMTMVCGAATARPSHKTATSPSEDAFCSLAKENVSGTLKQIASINATQITDDSAIRQGAANSQINGLMDQIRENMEQMRDHKCKPYPFPISEELYAPAAIACHLQRFTKNGDMSQCNQGSWEPGALPVAKAGVPPHETSPADNAAPSPPSSPEPPLVNGPPPTPAVIAEATAQLARQANLSVLPPEVFNVVTSEALSKCSQGLRGVSTSVPAGSLFACSVRYLNACIINAYSDGPLTVTCVDNYANLMKPADLRAMALTSPR